MKIGFVSACLLVAACSQAPENAVQEDPIEIPAANDIKQTQTQTQTSSAETGTPVSVPSDAGAEYWIMSKDKLPTGNIQLLTRRSGPSGVSFARREIDCRAGTVRYLGEGDTLDDAQRDSANIGEMSVPIPESITGVITSTACAD